MPLALWGALLVAGFFFRYLLQYVSSVAINNGVYEKCVCYQKMLVGEKSAKLPLISFEDSRMLDMQKRAMECADREILSSLYMTASVFTTNMVGIVSVLLVLAQYHRMLVWISVLSVLPFFIIRYIRGREFYRMKYFQAQKQRKAGYYWEILTRKESVRELRMYHAVDYIEDKWRRVRNDMEEETRQFRKKDVCSMIGCDLLRTLGYGGSIFFVICLVIRAEIGIGVLGACIAAFSSMQEQTKNFLSELGRMTEFLSYARDFFDFLDLSEEDEKMRKADMEAGNIRLEGVSFTYPLGEKEAVKDIDLLIREKEKIVLLGENGSGKSTLVKILLGLYSPTKGRVLCNGEDLNAYAEETGNRRKSAVLQDFTKFELTVKENVSISDISRMDDEKEIKHALKQAGLGSMAEDSGLKKVVGRKFGEIDFSGGQWQRLAIARGIFRDSEMIILDEPTSALDPMAEFEILQQFLAAIQDKTSVIVSHRVGLCRYVDRIIMMKDGKIVEMGSHEELYEKKGIYYNFYREQAKWYS